MGWYTVDELVKDYREVESGWKNHTLTLMEVTGRLSVISTRAKTSGVYDEFMARLRKEDGRE